VRLITDAVYFQEHGTLVRRLMREGAVDVAQDPEDERHIYGYIAHDRHRRVIHWLNVKKTYWRLGLARSLLLHAIGRIGEEVVCTHGVDAVFGRGGPLRDTATKYGLTYNPYVLRGTNA